MSHKKSKAQEKAATANPGEDERINQNHNVKKVGMGPNTKR
jgi:hypothetical protein